MPPPALFPLCDLDLQLKVHVIYEAGGTVGAFLSPYLIRISWCRNIGTLWVAGGGFVLAFGAWGGINRRLHYQDRRTDEVRTMHGWIQRSKFLFDEEVSLTLA